MFAPVGLYAYIGLGGCDMPSGFGKRTKSHRHPRRQPTGRAVVAVVDRPPLAQILQLVQAHYGTQGKAARALDLSREHFNRLVRGVGGKALTRSVFDRLRKILFGLPDGPPGKYGPAHAQNDFLLAFLTPAARDVSDAYLWWLRERLFQIGRYAPHPVSAGARPGDAIPVASSSGKSTSWLFDRQLELAERVLRRGGFEPSRQASQEILVTLRRHRSYGGYFDTFERKARKRGHSETRILVAFARVVEPLAATVPTSGVERSWEELDHTKQLKQYLNLAFAREEILLRRAPDYWSRIQEVGSSRSD